MSLWGPATAEPGRNHKSPSKCFKVKQICAVCCGSSSNADGALYNSSRCFYREPKKRFLKNNGGQHQDLSSVPTETPSYWWAAEEPNTHADIQSRWEMERAVKTPSIKPDLCRGPGGGGSRSLFACSSCDSYSVLKLWACVNRVCVLCCSGSQWVPPKAPIERRPRNTSKERRFPLFSKQDLTCWDLTGSRIWTGTKNVVEFNLGGNWTVQSGCWDL